MPAIEFNGTIYDFRECDTERKGIYWTELQKAAKERGKHSYDPWNGNDYLYISGIGWGIGRN